MGDRAVFLDRDGTINEEIGYLHEVEQLRFIDGAPAAIAQLNAAGFKVIVVTNQAGVARGYYAEASVLGLHRAMEEQLKRHRARIDAFYYCPHHPDGVGEYKIDCHCRKPKPGMLEQAARDLGIELGGSFVVGDRISDLEAGRAAGCTLVLVRTGYGRDSERELERHDLRPDFIASDVVGACEWILRPERQLSQHIQ